MTNKTTLKAKIVLVIFGIVLSLFMLELGLRLAGGIYLTLQDRRNKSSLIQKEQFRIMCLGESTTAFGGRYSYPTQLEEILNSQNIGVKFSIINRGRDGGTTIDILEHLESDLNEYRPDLVIAMMAINDTGKHMPYEDIDSINTKRFVKSFRLYKLIRLLWLHTVTKASVIKIYLSSFMPHFSAAEPKVDYNVEADPLRAEKLLKKAIESDPKNSSLFVNLGWSYTYQEKFIEAESSFKKAIELAPKNHSAYLGLGYCYTMQGNSHRAEEPLRKAGELGSKNDNGLYQALGFYFMDAGKSDMAEQSFKKALALDNKNSAAYVDLGWYYIKNRRFSEAEELLKEGVVRNPGNDILYGALGLLYNVTGEYGLAERYYKKANDRRLMEYNSQTRHNYQKLKDALDARKIGLVCVQYPMRNVEPLKKMFEPLEDVVFVDNEKVFKEALKGKDICEYFSDIFGGEFGHCTPKGNRLLAENIADAILKKYFTK